MSQDKILLVDDDEDVREVIKMHLESAGYRNILEAENGEKAINILLSEDHIENIALILCDIRMPKINGLECIDFFRREAPGIPVVVVTGYPETELAASLIGKGVKEYLVKPIEKEKLLKIVRQLVAPKKNIES
jgi:two-component system chemotaxis response regulator CheY